MPYTIYIWATHSSTHNIFAFVLKRLGYRVTFIDQHWSGPEPGLDNVQVIIFDPAVEPEQARAVVDEVYTWVHLSCFFL